MSTINEVLKANNLRDTQSRRTVLEALHAHKQPLQPREIHDWITEKNLTISIVTVYRILETFEAIHVVHNHPSGGYSLCTLDTHTGHHGFLRCNDCGGVEEFVDPMLCKLEDTIAKQHGFTPKSHFTEIAGLCPSCS